MPSVDLNPTRRVVVLGTGGTIAGAAASRTDNVGYEAAQIGVEQLVAAVPALAEVPLESEQVAQLDSSAMTAQAWQALARRAAFHLQRDEVAGLVVAHGTDTLEESAWFLHRVLAPGKPLVLTAAMRPATAILADGPQNLLDAVSVARGGVASGVVVVFAGRVHAALSVQKMHGYRLDAFASPDAGALARIEEGQLIALRPWPTGEALGLEPISRDPASWPWVDIVTSHAAARPHAVDALTAAGVRGLVVAGTGSGSVHDAIKPALARAEAAGVIVVLASRCASGPVLAPHPKSWQVYPGLNAAKSRVELMLTLMAADGASKSP